MNNAVNATIVNGLVALDSIFFLHHYLKPKYKYSDLAALGVLES